ncbi:MAG: acyl-CoA thioesterase [Planctomycetota bacterium]|jgi:acyl-CoA thioesterase YciA
MTPTPPPPQQDPTIRTLMLPRDTNERGTIFGGRILELIDLAAAVEARRFNPRHRYVTVAMKEVVFHEPVEVGDIVSCYSATQRVGTTSITIKVDVVAERGRDLAKVSAIPRAGRFPFAMRPPPDHAGRVLLEAEARFAVLASRVEPREDHTAVRYPAAPAVDGGNHFRAIALPAGAGPEGWLHERLDEAGEWGWRRCRFELDDRTRPTSPRRAGSCWCAASSCGIPRMPSWSTACWRASTARRGCRWRRRPASSSSPVPAWRTAT